MTFGISTNTLFIVVICTFTAVSIALWTIALRSVLRVLDFVIAQFKTDSGTSLRDVVDRVETGTDRLEASVLEAKGMAVLLHDLLLRMETAQGVVADDLARAQLAVDGVAEDLADAHSRADDEPSGNPGAAADAASKSGET